MNHDTSETIPHKKKQIVIVVMTGNMLLNFAGPTDVFVNANRNLKLAGINESYEVLVVAPFADKKVNTETGMSIVCERAAMEVEMDIDTLIIGGNDFRESSQPALKEFYDWLAKRNDQNTRRIASVCGGAFVLARAGILDGRKATTHWELAQKLTRECPAVQVNSNPFYTNDGHVYSSAGVSSGIDLSLALVEEDFGKDIAIGVARKLVFYLSRPGFQAQFGNLLPIYETEHIAHKTKSWLSEHLHEKLDVNQVADQLHMSTRNFTRIFHKHTGMPPAKFIEKLRIETARKFLEDTDTPIARIAEQCGFGGLVSMRRTFLRHLMTTPSDYRRLFRTSLQDTGMTELVAPKFNAPAITA